MNHLSRAATLAACVFVTAPLAAPLLAQELPEPAPQLKKLDHLVGKWEHKGTAEVQPGMPPMPWEATSHSRWVLGGHALCDDMIIEFPEAPVGRIVMRTYTTFDTDSETYRTFTVSNEGKVSHGELHFVDSTTTVQVHSATREGTPVIVRWVTTWKDGTTRFHNTVMLGDEEPKTEIKGEGKKATDKADDIDLSDYDPFMPIPAPPEMERVGKTAGTYSMEGMSQHGADAESIPVKGKTTVKVLFDGQIVFILDEGTSYPYRGHHYLAWDPETKSYAHFGVTNVGHASAPNCRWIDNHLVFTDKMMVDGQPMVDRAILTVNDDGKLTSMESHVISGIDAPFKTFSCKWTPN